MSTIDAHYVDHLGRPEGGCSTGIGFTISWQRGPCPSPEARNGAFLIEVLESCEKRLAYYQSSEFACDENADALAFLVESIASLKRRRDRRRDAGTLGTHEPDAPSGARVVGRCNGLGAIYLGPGVRGIGHCPGCSLCKDGVRWCTRGKA